MHTQISIPTACFISDSPPSHNPPHNTTTTLEPTSDNNGYANQLPHSPQPLSTNGHTLLCTSEWDAFYHNHVQFIQKFYLDLLQTTFPQSPDHHLNDNNNDVPSICMDQSSMNYTCHTPAPLMMTTPNTITCLPSPDLPTSQVDKGINSNNQIMHESWQP